MLKIGAYRHQTVILEGHPNPIESAQHSFAATLRVRCLQGGINDASVGLCPRFIFSQNGLHLAKIKCGVDVFTSDVLFNLSKLFSKRLAIPVVLLDGAHSLSVTFL